MANEQAASSPPENESYDAGMLADVRAAFTEATTKEPEAPAEVVAEKPAEVVAEAPAETRSDHPTDPKRYADGTFKPVKGEEKPAGAAAKPAELTPAAEINADVKLAETDHATQKFEGNPPPGWSVASKAAWDKLPEHIRADIIKRETEVNTGFAQYAGMKELLPYQQRAQSQGGSLKQMLDGFIGLEEQLRQNPEHGFLTIANRLGISPQRLAQSFAQYAPSTGQYEQQGYQQPADGGYTPQIDPSLLQQHLNPLSQEVSQLRSFVQQIQAAETTRYTTAFNAAQTRFTSEPDSRYFENVKPLMVKLFESGIVPETGDHYADLKAAYEKACNLTPEIAELRINERIAKTDEARRKAEQEAAEKARLASRSITGSPAAGAKDTSDTEDSIEADVRRAYRAHAA
jgi:hypothetical protein